MLYVFALKKYMSAVFLHWNRMWIWSNIPEQGHLEPDPWEHIQAALEYLQGRTLHNLHQQPDPLLRQRVSWCLKGSPPVPIASCPVTEHPWQEPGSILFVCCLQHPPQSPLPQDKLSQFPLPLLTWEISYFPNHFSDWDIPQHIFFFIFFFW